MMPWNTAAPQTLKWHAYHRAALSCEEIRSGYIESMTCPLCRQVVASNSTLAPISSRWSPVRVMGGDGPHQRFLVWTFNQHMAEAHQISDPENVPAAQKIAELSSRVNHLQEELRQARIAQELVARGRPLGAFLDDSEWEQLGKYLGIPDLPSDTFLLRTRQLVKGLQNVLSSP